MSFTFRAIVALSVTAASIAPAQQGTAATEPPCPTPALSTADWVSAVGFDVGIEILHPADYRRQIWESVSDTTKRYVEVHKNFPSSTVVVESSYRARRLWRTEPYPSERACTIQTRSGPMSARISRLVYVTGGNKRDSSYNITMRVSTPRVTDVILFTSSARDSAEFLVHLGIATTVRLLDSRP